MPAFGPSGFSLNKRQISFDPQFENQLMSMMNKSQSAQSQREGDNRGAASRHNPGTTFGEGFGEKILDGIVLGKLIQDMQREREGDEKKTPKKKEPGKKNPKSSTAKGAPKLTGSEGKGSFGASQNVFNGFLEKLMQSLPGF